MATFKQIQTRDIAAGQACPGLSRAYIALAAALAVWSLPYLVSDLKRFRVWTAEEALPFTKSFRTDSSGPIVAEAAGGLVWENSLREKEKKILREERSLEKKPILLARAKPGKKGLAIKIPQEEYADVTVHIADPHGAMKHFYKALERTARGEKGAVTRIAHWGDSAVAQDDMTSVVRGKLQRRFGDAGHGFVLAAKASRWYRHRGVVFRSNGFKSYRITHNNARDRRYGLGGVRARGARGANATFATPSKGSLGRAVSRFDVFYLKGPRQGRFRLLADKKKYRVITAKADKWEDAVHTMRVPDGPHRLKISVHSGEVNLYGVALERDGPGVVYDTLGLVGYIGSRVLNADPEHFKAQLALRRPDLMVLMFGGNALGFKYWIPKDYKKLFTRIVKRFRDSRPRASCLVMSPLDHGEKVGKEIRTRARLLEMVAIQREVALENGCAFYSIFDAMGGEGTMGRWSRSRPRLAIFDLAHVTWEGAKVVGTLYYRALMAGFAKHLR